MGGRCRRSELHSRPDRPPPTTRIANAIRFYGVLMLHAKHHKGRQRRSRQRDARTWRQQEPTVYTATGFGDPQANGRLTYAQD